jgi:hypothetical protein
MEEAVARRARARRQNVMLAGAAGIVLTVIVTVGLVYTTLIMDVDRGRFEFRERSLDRFAATRTGIVRYGEGRRNRCRQVDFGNESGGFSNETYVRCEERSAADAGGDPAPSTVGSRFDAIRGGFTKK